MRTVSTRPKSFIDTLDEFDDNNDKLTVDNIDDDTIVEDESNTTSSIDGYMIPGAFGKLKPGTTKGWTPAPKSDPKLHRKLGESLYKQISDELFLSESIEDQPISIARELHTSISEIKKQLDAIEKIANKANRLKSKSKLDSKQFWKISHKSLDAIQERLYRLNSKLNDLAS